MLIQISLFLLGLVAQGATTLNAPELTESSGVCVSADGKIIWSHNDSGGKPRLFGFGPDGRLLGILNVDGARAVDWEDMCSFSLAGTDYLAVGDVGDNLSNRDSVQIYIVAAPDSRELEERKGLARKPVCRLTIRYPGGAVNCEAIAFDPDRKSLLLVSKELLRCRVFEAQFAGLEKDQEIEARLLGTLALPMVTGADVSRDGTRLVLSTYGPGCLVRRTSDGWQGKGEHSLQMFPLPSRKQGESICFDRTGERLLLTSEFAPTPLHQIECPKLDRPE